MDRPSEIRKHKPLLFLLLTSVMAMLVMSGCQSLTAWTNEADTAMITRNDFAKARGMKTMLNDVNECGTHAARERQRLQTETVAGDSYFQQQKGTVATGQAVGREIGEEFFERDTSQAPRQLKNGEIDKERLAGAAGAAALGFVVDVITSDGSKHDQEMMVIQLKNLKTYIRFKNICLRDKGYDVSEYAEDGVTTAHLEWKPLRVILRRPDGSETVMYQQPEADQ